MASGGNGLGSAREDGIGVEIPDLIERQRRAGVTDVVTDLPPYVVQEVVRYPKRETANHRRADDLDLPLHPSVR